MNVKKFFEKHGVTVCAVLSLIACIMPFYNASVESYYFDMSESYNLFQTLQDEFSLQAFLFLLLPVVLIVLHYVLKGKSRKISLLSVSAIFILNALVELVSSTGTFADYYYAAEYKPVFGFYFAVLCIIAALVMVIVQDKKRSASFSVSAPSGGAPNFQIAEQISSLAAKGAAMIASAPFQKQEDSQEKKRLRTQMDALQKELDKQYADLGKQYVDSLSDGSASKNDMDTAVQMIRQKKESLSKLEKELMEIEKSTINNRIFAEKQQALETFNAELAKLEKAVSMEVMSQEEFNEKRSALQRRMDNFEAIKRIEIQQEMGIITREEKDRKIAQLVE
ncbi:MAG: hypothetical protein PUB99_07345 [Oscillospiraceae bacterium]|nr:hypothetical protein [Oscillospiraceae bacterium]